MHLSLRTSASNLLARVQCAAWIFTIATLPIAIASCVGDEPTASGISDAGAAEAAIGDATAMQDGSAVLDATSSTESGPDGAANDAGDAGTCDLSHDWGPVSLLGGVNGSDDDEGAALTDDELIIVFATNRAPGGGANFDLWTASRADRHAPFNAPTILTVEADAGINTGFDDRLPSVTGDGLNLFFHTSRGPTHYDVWQASRSSLQSSFGAPATVSSIDTPFNDLSPFVLPDGSELFYSTESAPDGGVQIYEAARAGAGWTSQPVAGAGLTSDDHAPVLTHDGLRIYFASARLPSQGLTDIWTATRSAKNQAFGNATNVASLSSAAQDFPGWISADQCRFYLWSSRGGAFHIFFAERLP